MQEIYQERILQLARSIKLSKPIANPTHRAEKNNPICGDKVIIEVTIKDNFISDIHLIVRGCALCEAGAGVWKETAIGKSSNELYLLKDELNNYLKHEENISSQTSISICSQNVCRPLLLINQYFLIQMFQIKSLIISTNRKQFL